MTGSHPEKPSRIAEADAPSPPMIATTVVGAADVSSWPRGRSGLWAVLVPCLLIVGYASPLVGFLVPSNFCLLTESVEPLKTLRLVHSRGTAVHKWGNLPCFLYAPGYAPFLGYWYLTGDLARPSTDYPYGFARPFEQQGTLIVVARLIGLAVSVACVAAYGRALWRATGSPTAAFVAVTLGIATSPELVFKFIATKPDGLMYAFLAASMACYSGIVADGLTRRRGIWMSIWAVASISCKEQTAPAFVLPYLGLAIDGLWRSADRRRFLLDYAATVAAGVVAYLVLNVVYAPASWLEHVRIWLVGPGKDPAIWASPDYTLSQYVGEMVDGLMYNLGIGGAVAIVGALAVSLTGRVPRAWLAWLPTISYAAIVAGTAGYMPRYFAGPVNILAALPVALAVAAVVRGLASGWPRRVALTVAAALIGVNLWTANYAWVEPYLEDPWMVEQYCREHVDKNELVHVAQLWDRPPGIDRLSYLGYRIDDRALGRLMDRPEPMPDLVLISREAETWLEQMARRPAQNAVFEETGYSYNRFHGVEALGYRLEALRRPRPPRWLEPAGEIFPWYRVKPLRELRVYRRAVETAAGGDGAS